MSDHDNGATIRLAATIARGRYDVDGVTMIADVHPETIVEMALAAKREVDRLRTELAEARAERDAAIVSLSKANQMIGRMEMQVEAALDERDAAIRERDEARRDLTEAIIRESEANRELGREQMRSEAARRERDARIPLASLPTEFVCGEWIMSGQAEPDAVVTYASEPSPETGHVGWCWWARGKMGEARDYVAAREAAEKALRAHAAGSTGVK